MPRTTPITHWSQLTRHGVPQFSVSRRPMVTLGQEIGIGEVLPAAIFSPNRLRALYEQRLIAPVHTDASPPASARPILTAGVDVQRNQVTITTDEIFFDAPAVPAVEEKYEPQSQSVKVGYRPRRGARTP